MPKLHVLKQPLFLNVLCCHFECEIFQIFQRRSNKSIVENLLDDQNNETLSEKHHLIYNLKMGWSNPKLLKTFKYISIHAILKHHQSKWWANYWLLFITEHTLNTFSQPTWPSLFPPQANILQLQNMPICWCFTRRTTWLGEKHYTRYTQWALKQQE